jgi:hypothetical protein
MTRGIIGVLREEAGVAREADNKNSERVKRVKKRRADVEKDVVRAT